MRPARIAQTEARDATPAAKGTLLSMQTTSGGRQQTGPTLTHKPLSLRAGFAG